MGTSRGKDDKGLRWYVDADGVVEALNTTDAHLSVTTVLKFLEEDTSGLERWKDRNDGSGDHFHHEHIYWYSAPRGTLCHYKALSNFEEKFGEGDDMWGEEESKSMKQIVRGPDEGTFDDASHDLDDICYSVMKNHGVVQTRDQHSALFPQMRLVDVLQEDMEYVENAFETVCDELGVAVDDVIVVEKFLMNSEVGYGGQCDMIYEADDGASVMVDLKTSGSLRQKHRLQSVAYKHAVEESDWGPDEIDRIEVWRLDPDAKNWQVHSHEVPDHASHLYDAENPATASYTDEYWFEDKWGDFDYDSLEDMWETFKDLVQEARNR